MTTFTLQEELAEWLDEEHGEGEFKDFSFYAYTDEGDFDREKGAMTGYPIQAINDITGEVYEGTGGYYNNHGHEFNYPVTFTLQVKKEEEIKPEFTTIKVLLDWEGEMYFVPQELWAKWRSLKEAINSFDEDDDDKQQELYDKFDDAFRKYKMEGSISDYQLLITKFDLDKITN